MSETQGMPDRSNECGHCSRLRFSPSAWPRAKSTFGPPRRSTRPGPGSSPRSTRMKKTVTRKRKWADGAVYLPLRARPRFAFARAEVVSCISIVACTVLFVVALNLPPRTRFLMLRGFSPIA